VKGRGLCCLAPLLLAACGNLQGFGGPAPPLATFEVVLHGDLAPLRPPGVTGEHALRVALVWGAQWLTEPFCVLPAESPEAAAVIDAGCRDTFGFVPATVSVSVPITPEAPVTLSLSQLPAADVMVGDVTARVAYGSLVVFDDRDDTGTLELSRPIRAPSGSDEGRRDQQGMLQSLDIIYGASFLTMTAPDQRVAYREGGFDTASAFYPRAGCDPPLPGFSVLAAGGFSPEAGIASALSGGLPPEDPSTCAVSAPVDTTIEIAARAPADVQEVDCDERTADSSVRYREPPAELDLTNRTVACAHLPTFETGGSGPAAGLIQLVVSGHPFERCKGLTHYTLRGCREDVNCPIPDWDFTANPPSWWPSSCGP
jgi:hypothetical protein